MSNSANTSPLTPSIENVPILLITVTPPPTSTPTTPTPSFFHIHSNLLLPFSPPFTRLFDALPTPPPGQWKALTITEIPAPIFASFVQWLYYGDKHFAALESDANDAATPSFALSLAQLCIVAERYDVNELQDAVVAEVARYWNETRAPPPSGLVEYVYANTVAGSVMRRLVVEWHGVRGDDWFGSQEAKEVLARVPAFAGELAMALGLWHGRGGGALLIERDEEGEGDESSEQGKGDETSEEGKGDESSMEGSADVTAEVREGSEENEGGDGSVESECTLPG